MSDWILMGNSWRCHAQHEEQGSETVVRCEAGLAAESIVGRASLFVWSFCVSWIWNVLVWTSETRRLLWFFMGKQFFSACF